MLCDYCYSERFEELFHSNEWGALFHPECIFRMIEEDPDDMDVQLLYYEWLQTLNNETDWGWGQTYITYDSAKLD
ncbi:hypothetical protein [Tenuibacillus multivorans]|uniref:Uncharacterized protein n=1 Tax=Tenuibacillus multivorans TaxID=237069 RepID=A0A1G9X768_9BACI|nr:hypothetical protein [Tenuibacillus multivorans]GEL78664.1 hypothetical protein TMU01_28990 [Tenuibacillus multivorans]SDM92584.1 hypothetical protein SAMN05216498_1044 [Tenuibacillus multivorans]